MSAEFSGVSALSTMAVLSGKRGKRESPVRLAMVEPLTPFQTSRLRPCTVCAVVERLRVAAWVVMVPLGVVITQVYSPADDGLMLGTVSAELVDWPQ